MIPSEAEFVFTAPISNVEVFDVTVNKIVEYLKAVYGNTEKHFTIKCIPL